MPIIDIRSEADGSFTLAYRGDRIQPPRDPTEEIIGIPSRELADRIAMALDQVYEWGGDFVRDNLYED